MSELGQQKSAQAALQLEAQALWLFLTQEGSDPSVPLVFDTNTVGKSAFMLGLGGARALVPTIDVGHLALHSPFIEARSYTTSFAEALSAWLQELQPARIYLNYSQHDIRSDGLTHGLYLSLMEVLNAALPGAEVLSSEVHLARVRAVKTPEELRRLQQAIDRTVAMYDALLSLLHAGMTEKEVQGEMNTLAAGLGAPADPGDFGGPLVLINRVGMAHRAPTDEPIAPGDLLILDTALQVEGYYSDLARTVYFLKADETVPPVKEQRVFKSIYGAINAAFDALKPGVAGYQVDAAARQHLLHLGYPEIQHATGHQIGRQVHDGGTLLGPLWEKNRYAANKLVEAGMVFTLEPTVLMTPEPSMIVEENVLVTDQGARYLNPRQETLWTAR